MFPNPSFYTLPHAVQTRWASPENPNGEKGAAAKSGEGRKGHFLGVNFSVIADQHLYFKSW